MSSYVILGGIACLVFAIPMVVGVNDPRYVALAALFIAAPLEVYRAEAVVGNLSVFRIVLLVAIVVALRHRRSTVSELFRNPIALVAAAMLLMIALSLLLLSQNRSLAFSALGQGGVVFIAALTTASLAHGMSARSILKLACAGAVLPVLAAGIQGFHGRAAQPFNLPLVSHLPVPEGLEVTRAGALYVGEDGVRLNGTFGDPNHFAAWLVFVIASSFVLTISSGLHGRRVSLLAGTAWCAGLSAVLLATYSRSGWLSGGVSLAVAATVVAFSPAARAVLRRHRRWAIAATLICCVAIAPLFPRIAERLDNSRSANRISNDSHALTARVAYEEFVAHPLTGIGISDLGPRLGQPPRTSVADSSYLTVAAELGLPGLLALLVFFFLVAKALAPSGGPISDRFARFGLFCAYVGFIVINAFYDVFWDDFHWLFVGVALASVSRKRSCRDPSGLA